MQEQQLFEYAVLRVVPRVEREEFLNVGVVLYCRKLNFLQCLYEVDVAKLQAFYDKIDIAQLQQYLSAFRMIAEAHPDGGPISKLDTASRFRWLTATRSTVIQTSKVHPAFCTNPEEALKKLFAEYVL
ncbi:MAG: DUF3037 domain-containing protein [Flavipsychrobacter sp.]|nr:DUF3037 domain-containing protein [Flavipsychrobacter sp.]